MTFPSSLAPWWRPDQFAAHRPALAIRQQVLRATRSYFETQGFDEVETPALQISPGNEVHLHAFKTSFVDPHADKKQDYYLHTSPEFAMKKLLVAGAEKIFQLAHVFRNGERSSRHHPEFSMLEWYRTGANLASIKRDCIELVRTAATAAKVTIFSGHEMECDPLGDWQTLTVPDAFKHYAEIDLLNVLDDAELFRRQTIKAGFRATDGDSWDDLFFRIMGECIEPQLGRGTPTFLCDYPISMAALARPKHDDPRLAERFELYICGYEIANAFDELTDVVEQEKRFRADMDAKEQIYGERYPIDDDFIAALRHGMPASSGIALGFDRLVMLCAGRENIDDVLWVPVA